MKLELQTLKLNVNLWNKTILVNKFKMSSNLQIGQEIVAKYNIREKPLYIKVLWKENNEDLFHIMVFYEDNTWTGNYSTELATKRRERLDESVEEYNSNVKKCLSGATKGYIYDFTYSPDDINSANFVWKKQYENALKIQGLVPLQRDKVPTPKNALIDILLEQNKSLLSQVDQAKRANENLKQEQGQCMRTLEELTESKILLESTLYGRFVQVLNEKKKRIKLLDDQLKSL